MKRLYLLLLTLLVISCSDKEVELKNLVERNGLIYEVNKQKPYTGIATQKLQNGTILLSGKFNKGKKSGEWTSFAENGQKLQVENYDKNGNYHGLVEEYDRKGQIKTKYTYSEGKRDGLFELYYRNGAKKQKGSYKNGQYDETINEWFENGKQKSTITYSIGKKNGEEEIFSNNGGLTRKAFHKNGKLHGNLVEYYSNGKPKTETEYKNGEIQGKYISYYFNGNKQFEYQKLNGKYKDLYTEYNEDGSVHRQFKYKKDGKINYGTWKKYWVGNNPTKEVAKEYSTVSFNENGKPSTSAKFYYSNGKLKSERNYSSIEPDIRDGVSKWFYNDGLLKMSYTYKDDVPDGKFETYYKRNNSVDNTRKKEVGFYRNGKIEGIYTWYNGHSDRETPNDQVSVIKNGGHCYKLEATFVNGKLHGRAKNWWFDYWRSKKNIPIYIAHDYSHGDAEYLSNGYGSKKYPRKTFKDRYFDKNDNPLSYSQAQSIKKQYRN